MGEAVDACSICYARGGRYHMNAVKAPRFHNMKDWKRGEWVSDMVDFLKGKKYFRWFDSGDIYTYELAAKIFQVCIQTPWCEHWVPTRSYKIGKIKRVLEALNTLSNVCCRYSSDSIVGNLIGTDAPESTIIQYAEDARDGYSVCEAYTRGGKCGECRDCWDKKIKVIAYPSHGQSAKKAYKEMEV